MDNAGLGNFHIRIDKSSNTMTIVGECGQSFVSISGIKFARLAPSAAEIPLAVELLGVFLIKHKPDFDKYIAELAAYNKIPKIKAHTDRFDIFSTGYGDTLYWSCRVRSGCFRVKVLKNGLIDGVSINGSTSKFGIDEFSKGPNIAHLHEAHAYLKAYLKYLAAGKALTELKTKLSSCEI